MPNYLCDPLGTRTRNLLLRRQLLYPIELADHLLPCSAERGGFEPPVRFPVRMFSKHVVSATHPSLRLNVIALKRIAKLDKNNYYPNAKSKKNYPTQLKFSTQTPLRNMRLFSIRIPPPIKKPCVQ